MRGVKYYRGLLLVLVALLLLTGCPVSAVQPNQFTAFKTATASLAESASTSYDLAVSQWAALAPKCLAKYSSNTEIGKSAAYLIKWGEFQCENQQFQNPQRDFEIRLKSLSLLADYAAKIALVATADYAGNLETSSAKLGVQAASVAEASDPLITDAKKSKEAVKGLGIVVGEVASLYIERKRAEVLRLELKRTQPYLEQLARALKEDNRALNIYSDTVLAAERLIANTVLRPEGYDKRLSYDTQRLLLERNHKLRSDAFKLLNAAIGKLPEAHAELLRSLDKQESMKALGELLGSVDEVALLLRQVKAK